MTRNRSITLLAGAAAVALIALAVAGCGGGGATASMAPAKTATRTATTLATANTGLGKILVDSKGRSLYLFKKDMGTKSTCFGACASAWPPLRANGKPSVGGGANAALVATVTRSDGKPQVTYNGHPLYLYQGDQKPGDTNGQGLTAFGAAWYTLTPSGNQISAQPPNPGGSSSGGGSGY